MRAESLGAIRVDLIGTKSEIGELAKLAVPLGYVLDVRPSEDMKDTAVATFRREHWTFLENELAAMVVLQAVSRDVAPDTILAEVGKRVARLGMQMTTRPSDTRAIGEGAA